MPITLPQGFGNPQGDNYLTHLAEAKPFAAFGRNGFVFGKGPRHKKTIKPLARAKLPESPARSKCQLERDWLVNYAGYSRKKLKKLNCAQVHAAVELIKIRDGLK